MCRQSDIKFNLLTPKTLCEHLPPNMLHENYRKLSQVATKAGAIRAALLATHGGWWWDADTIALQSPAPLAESYPGASILFTTWTKQPRRAINGYIYAKPDSTAARSWLNQVNYKLEHHLELAGQWTELGEKILTPVVNGHTDCVEVPRELFLPIDIDSNVKQFFVPGNWQDSIVSQDTVCFGLNHSYFMHWHTKVMELSPNCWVDSPLLIHSLLDYARGLCLV